MIALKNILVATDFGEPSHAALRYGMELARQFGSSLHVLHVVDDLVTFPDVTSPTLLVADRTQETMEEVALEKLGTLVPEPDRTDLHVRLLVMTSTAPAMAIVSYARRADVDLIIVGTHGRKGLPYFFLGSVAQQVSRMATCPVLTVRARERDFVVPDVAQRSA